MSHFKLETEILQLMCMFEVGEELEFRYAFPAPVVVSLRERQHRGDHHPHSDSNAVCTAIMAQDIGRDMKAEMAVCTDSDHVCIEKLRPNTLELIDRVFDKLRTLSRSTVTIFNWRHGLDSPFEPYGPTHAWYSEDGNRWSSCSRNENLRFAVTRRIYARAAQVDEVVRKVEAKVEEPLGRQLFREARNHLPANPRSALVIAVTAAEVGLKRLIAILVPGTDWLMEEIQTPPVGKMLRKFLPTLSVKAKRVDGGQIMPPRELIRQIEKAIEHRNKIVHVGALPPAPEQLAVMLSAISDFLWICDIYSGEHWAGDYVSGETMENWRSKSS